MAFYRCGSGGITPAKLYEALQYSGIITENMTSKQMLEALATHFPDAIFDETSTWSTNSIESTIVRSGKDILLKSEGWNGENRTFTTNDIPVGNYSKMRIKGTLYCDGSATGTEPTLTITVGVKQEYQKTYTLPVDEDFEIETEARKDMVVRMDSWYSAPYVTLSIQLYN